MSPSHVVLAGRIQPFDKAVLVGPTDGFAVNSADVHERTPILREIPDGCWVIYWPACFGVQAHHHSLDIFGGAGLDHGVILEHMFECLNPPSIVKVDAAQGCRPSAGAQAKQSAARMKYVAGHGAPGMTWLGSGAMSSTCPTHTGSGSGSIQAG
jgi:hypothetical protein